MTEGLLAHSTPERSWAWVGLRLAPARALDAHGGYADRPEEQRWAATGAGEAAWLRALCRPEEPVRFDLRYLSEPGGGLLRCVLLAQAAAATPQRARVVALDLRERLARLPSHVLGRPIGHPHELHEALDPFGADRSAAPQLIEFRQRLTAHQFVRPDADRSHAVLTYRLPGAGPSWEPFWTALAARQARTALSIALEPARLEPAEWAELSRYAGEYRRLAAPSRSVPSWQLTAPPDPAAHAAAEHLEFALHRAAQPGYRLRITLATEAAGRAGLLELAHLLAALIGGPEQAVAVLPVAAGEEAVALANLTGLNLSPLPHTYAQGLPPRHYGWVEQTVSGFAEAGEAAGALRLPYQVLSHRPLFDDRFLAQAPPAPPPAPPRTQPADRPRF